MYYSLEILSQPKIEHALSSTERLDSLSQNIIDRRKNIIELSWTSGAELAVEVDGIRTVIESETLRLYFPDEKYILTPAQTGKGNDIRICDVAVSIEEMKLSRLSLNSDAEIAEWLESSSPDTILLSDSPDLPKEAVDSILQLMQSTVNCRLDRSTAGRLKCLSLWYETVALLDNSLRAQLCARLGQVRKTPSSAYYHVYRIKKYISAHLTEKLSVDIIADSVGLSSDYVGRIFRKECGMSIPTYITQKRVEHIRRMIDSNPKSSLADIAASAGFSDLRYSQRIFKQYTGITMQRCRQLGNGMTLWRSDPWRQRELDRDIYVSGEEDADDNKP